MNRPLVPKPSKRVLILVETSKTFGRKIIEGIYRYSQKEGEWMLILENRGLDELEAMTLRKIPCDGIISRTTTPLMFEALHHANVPVVELLGDGKEHPANIANDRAIAGKMAFEHLRDRRVRHFGFFSLGHCWWSREMLEAFRTQCKQHSFPCHVCETEKTPNTLSLSIKASSEVEVVVARWLCSIPKPVGVLCPEDDHAVFLLNMCRDCGIAVPFDVAVLGMGNHPTLCDATSPPLSSLVFNCSAIGYQAAKLLDRKLKNEKYRETTQKIAPLYVNMRHSTNFVSVVDKDIRVALKYISDHLAGGFTLEQLASHIGFSKRSLIRRFNKVFGYPPEKEILLIRLSRAKKLLVETDLTIGEIASCVGYQTPEYFIKMFRQHLGVTPNHFRKQSQGLRMPELEH